MVGSTQSISDPNVVLNTIVADVFADVCDRLEKVEGGVEAVANGSSRDHKKNY